MFQNPGPVSTFRETVGWSVPVSKPSYTLKVPPIGSSKSSSSSVSPERSERPARPPPSSSTSSSSSLGGLEQAIPSFQTFIKRTPSIDSNPHKPLSPTPIATKRSEGSLTDAYYRRQSSIYSRNPSYASTGQQSPWKVELPEAGSPPVLQPIAYSMSSPDLTQQEEKVESYVQYLESRVFAPLVDTPSTLSMVTVKSPPASRPQSILPAAVLQAFNQKPPTVSLEQAKEAMNAPGAVRLLPEELTALRKVKSQGRLESIDIFGAGQKALLPTHRPQPTWRDSQGRTRTLSTDMKPGLKSPTQISFHAGTGPVREMKPYVPEEEPRGRTIQRLSTQCHGNDSKKDSQADFAEEDNSLLSQQFRVPSCSPGSASDNSVSKHMKMVPQPLFQAKMRPESRRTIGSRGSTFSVSPFSGHRRGRSESTRSSGTGFNLRLSADEGYRTRGNSTIGMIPISPPLDHKFRQGKLPPIDTDVPPGSRPKIHKREKSASLCYPHIMHRKISKDKKLAPVKILNAPGKPLLPAEVIAQRLKTPESTPETSPLANSPLRAAAAAAAGSKPSDTGSERSKRRLYHRLATSVRNRRRSSQKSLYTEPDMSPTLNSPRLFPTPGIHLGWSDTAKRNFDEAKSPATSRPRLQHIVLPAKPLDERVSHTEPESPSMAKRVNLFGSVLENWGENKAQKKREDLKKLIKVVPAVVKEEKVKREESGGSRRGSLFGVPALPAVLPRRMSTYGWL